MAALGTNWAIGRGTIAAARVWCSPSRVTKQSFRLDLSGAAAPWANSSGESLDDNHVSTAAWTQRMDIDRLFQQVVIGWWHDSQEFAGAREVGLARRSGEQAIVTELSSTLVLCRPSACS